MRSVVFLLLCFLMSSQAFAGASGVVSERIYTQLTQVHELMGEARYEQALKRLRKIRASKKRPYEQALVRQTYAYTYAAQEKYPQAIEAFMQCLSHKALPQSATKNTLYALAQLQINVADFPAAIDTLEQWFKLEKAPTPQAHALAGTAYAQAKQYVPAIEHLRKAIAMAGDAGETWYRQLLVIYYDDANFQAAARLLEEMTQRFPARKAYWLQLSAVYRSLKNDAKSLAMMELAYQRGLLTDEQELVELTHYYLYMDMPLKAGKLIEIALQDGTLHSTGKHWRLLSDAWLRAKETQSAIEALQQAAQLTQEAAVYLRLAQLAAQVDDWSKVIQASEKSREIGGLKQLGKAHILEGMAHYHRQDYSAARASFERAGEYAAVQDQALQWLDYLASEVLIAETSSFEY